MQSAQPSSPQLSGLPAAPGLGKPPPKERPTGRGVVKAVPSGDQVILVQIDKPGHPELELTFSGVQAPRLGRRGFAGSEASDDEPFAWQSREYLRKKVVGKTVQFVINHSMTSKSGKPLNFGTITLSGATTEPVHHACVAEGWLRVKPPTGDRTPNTEQTHLLSLAQTAEQNGVGVHSADTREALLHRVQSSYDFFALLQSHKGKPTAAVVESVRDGCTLRLLLIPSFHDVLLHVGGVQTPTFTVVPKKDSHETEVLAEPGAKESRLFAEQQLLHRDVEVVLEGQLDKRGTFYGTVLTLAQPRLNWAEELLRGGWARYVEWNAPPALQSRYKSLEREAQQNRLRLWHSYTPTAAVPAPAVPAAVPAAGSGGGGGGKSSQPVVPSEGAEFFGKVRQVQSAGQLLIEDGTNPAVVYVVALASLQIPRAGLPSQPDEAWGHEAREALRSRLIGKKVRVTVDYVRQAQARVPGDKPAPPKAFCTVLHDRVNVALRIVEEGLATVISHRSGERRSSHWEALALAEENAKKKNKGLHGRAEAPKHLYTVVTKPIKFMPHISRGRQPAVVEWVLSATRLKLQLPTHSVVITFALQGVQGPLREDKWNEPAIQFTRDKCLQRDVEVELEGHDTRGPAFRGTLWLKKKNFALTLVEQGYATCSAMVSRLPNREAFEAAELQAKQQQLRIWEGWTPEAEAERKRKAAAEEEAAAADDEEGAPGDGPERSSAASSGSTGASSAEGYEVVVTEFVDASCFYAQTVGEAQKQLDALVKKLATLNVPDAPVPSATDLTPGTWVLAEFTADQQWYRARVESVGRAPNSFRVVYVDFGNVEDRTLQQLRPIPQEFKQLPAQANEFNLAFVRTLPLTSDLGQEAAQQLKELVFGKTVHVTVEYRDGGKLFVTVRDPQTKQSVNAALIRQGLAKLAVPRFVRHRVDPALLAKLEDEQQLAKRDRMGIYSYAAQSQGLVLDDDEEEKPPAAAAAAAAAAASSSAPKGAWAKGAGRAGKK